MSVPFFIADCHFGHRNILKYRTCFNSVKEHDECIMDNWNSIVNKRSPVWVLGDFFINNKEYDFVKILKSLKGQIRIITGNHCSIKDYPSELINNGILKKYGFWLSHCPIHPIELRGKKNIHGHVHNKTIPDDRYINVCVDVTGFKPVSLDDIKGDTKKCNSGYGNQCYIIKKCKESYL